MRHANIAIFVPHEGCTHQCSFCNQRTISGTSSCHADTVQRTVETALATPGLLTENTEIAFFGGSFTAIPRERMLELLEAAYPYVCKAGLRGIRVSTRPDAINREILDLLKGYGVTAIELGAQSMREEVLLLNRRGHDARSVEEASRLIVEYGFELGLQMMTGLYGDDDEGALETAKRLIALSPQTVRIYPTVVLEGTYLHQLYQEGTYIPPTLEQAVALCARLLYLFHRHQIRVIRVGLHSGGGVEKGYVAGAYHPAFRELCEGEIYLERARELLVAQSPGEKILLVPPGEISKMIGQSKRNLKKLQELGYNCKVNPTGVENPLPAEARYVVKIIG